VIDVTLRIESGFLGDQKQTAATWAFGTAKIVNGRLGDIAGQLDAHRRFSSTLPARTPLVPMWLYGERTLWRRCDANMKLSWPVVQRTIAGNDRLCVKTARIAQALQSKDRSFGDAALPLR
jgi:hypothetical protein